MEPQNYELIIDKLRKILALKDSGNDGEARAAEDALNRLCRKYGISIDDLIDAGEEKKRVLFDNVGDKHVKDILFACYFRVTNQNEVSYYKYGRACVVFELTRSQEVELKELFDCMRKAYKKGVEQLVTDYKDAFVIKNQLYSDVAKEQAGKDHLSPEEKARLWRIFSISNTFDRTPIPRKMLEK